LKAPILPAGCPGQDASQKSALDSVAWLPQTEREISTQRTGVCYPDARHPIAATAKNQIRCGRKLRN